MIYGEKKFFVVFETPIGGRFYTGYTDAEAFQASVERKKAWPDLIKRLTDSPDPIEQTKAQKLSEALKVRPVEIGVTYERAQQLICTTPENILVQEFANEVENTLKETGGTLPDPNKYNAALTNLTLRLLTRC